MRIAAISDVHSNFAALVAVLRDIERRKADRIVFVGDAVGYGPAPNDCTLKLRDVSSVMIAGNHDHGALELTDISRFNEVAQEVTLWTRGQLSPEAKNILRALPLEAVVPELDTRLVHASPWEPSLWHYVKSQDFMLYAFKFFTERVCLIGHTHVPYITELDSSGTLTAHGGKGPRVEFRQGSRYLINTGSVGQPRDQDPRASYLIMDDSGAEIVRVEYPVERTREIMQALGFHTMLIERLKYGF